MSLSLLKGKLVRVLTAVRCMPAFTLPPNASASLAPTCSSLRGELVTPRGHRLVCTSLLAGALPAEPSPRSWRSLQSVTQTTWP